MRKVSRTDITGPASLLSAGQAGEKELQKAIRHYGSATKKKFPFAAYKGDDVRHTLEKLFHGKCAYCESSYDITGPVDIEHYRPKGQVEGIPEHRGYWCLAGDWTNLLPSCLDCNRRRYQLVPEEFASLTRALESARQGGYRAILSGKEASFPLAAGGIRVIDRPDPADMVVALEAEEALLLDPTRDDPAAHLKFFIDRENPLGLVFPASSSEIEVLALPAATSSTEVLETAREAGVSVRGAVSIQVYGLNRIALIQERTRVLRKLELLATIVIDMFAVVDSLSRLQVAERDRPILNKAILRARGAASRALGEIRGMASPSAPFSAMVAAWIEAFKKDISTPQPVPEALGDDPTVAGLINA